MSSRFERVPRIEIEPNELHTYAKNRGTLNKLTLGILKKFARVSFFFQAEDGIRDIGVTGVQTCALPISRSIFARHRPQGRRADAFARSDGARRDLRIGGCDDPEEAAVGGPAWLDRTGGRQPSAGVAPAHGRPQAHLLARNDARKAARGAREGPCLEGLLSSPRAEPGGRVGLRTRGQGCGIPAGGHQDRNPAPAEGTRESALVAP